MLGPLLSHAKTESFTIRCMAVLAIPQIQVQGLLEIKDTHRPTVLR